MRVRDLTNQRFGRLLPIERHGSDAQGRAIWLCLCDCGTVKTVPSRHLSSGATRSCGCYRVSRAAENGRKGAAKITGSLSHLYKPELEDADRVSQRNAPELREWRKGVYERDGYTCDLCGLIGGRLAAHHLYNWANYPSLRFELSNGVTLCVNDHRTFHSSLGGPRVSCTAEDYTRYKESHV